MQNNNVIVRDILKKFKFYEEALDTGKIISVKDGVARVNGLFGVFSGEMVQSGGSKPPSKDDLFTLRWWDALLILILILECLSTFILTQYSPLFSILLVCVLGMMGVLVYKDRLEVLLLLMTRMKFFFLGLFWLYHDYDVSTRVLSILLILAILKALSTHRKLNLVCGNENTKPSFFDASNRIARIFKYSKIELSSWFFALFEKIAELISVWVPHLFIVWVCLLIIVAVLDMSTMPCCMVFILSGGGMFVSIARLIAFSSKLDGRLFNILKDQQLNCCAFQGLAKIGKLTIAATSGYIGYSCFKETHPHAANSIDYFLADNIDKLNENTGSVIDMFGNAGRRELGKVLNVEALPKPKPK